jgi:hypothetical protein
MDDVVSTRDRRRARRDPPGLDATTAAAGSGEAEASADRCREAPSLVVTSRLGQHRLLLALTGIALAARLGVAVLGGLNEPPAPGSDGAEYDSYAWNLAQGRGYMGISPDVRDAGGRLLEHSTAYRVPGTPLLWAFLYRIVGHRYDVIRLTHCILGAASVALVYAIGRACFDRRVGLLAAGIWTLWPQSLFYSGELLSEALATVLFLWSVLACLQFARAPSWPKAAWAGALLGLAILTRPGTAFMLPLTAVWALWQHRRCPRDAILALMIIACAVLTLVPWTIRNYLVLGALVPLSTQGGSALLQGNNRIVATDPRYYGYAVWDGSISEYREAIEKPNDELERDRVAGRFARQWLEDNSDKWAFLVQAKLHRAFTPFLDPKSPALYRVGMLLSWGPILALAALAFVPSLWTMLRKGRPCWLLHLGILHYAFTSVVFYGFARYRYVVEGLCVILACTAVVWAWDALRNTRRPRLSDPSWRGEQDTNA